MSSNSKESRSWMRGGYPQNHQSATEGGVLYCSSPSDTSLIQPWTSPRTRRVNIDDFETTAKRGAISGPLFFTPSMEGTSTVPDAWGSTSSRSDCSDFEQSGKLHLSTPSNFSSLRSFMSKPIHPLSFPVQDPALDSSANRDAGFLEYDTSTLQRDPMHRLSSGSSSIDLADISDLFEFNYLSRSSNPSEGYKCGVCDRLLSQRSPWSSRRIYKSGDMPVTGVLFCRHVFHAECLEQTTPKSHRNDPSCPICAKVERENSPEQCVFPRIRNSFPRLRAFSEERPSRSWGCVQAGDCVEGALHAPHRSSMLILSRDKIKRNFSLKGKTGKDFPDKLKKTGSNSINFFGGKFVDHGAGGCSTTSVGSSSK